ncbi:MAG: SPOR domain-containing protein [Synergistaceae bacterium]|jgi:cell division protein FtsN|nr:SPOR domain-containing protein [Synergistaceae bacterium]
MLPLVGIIAIVLLVVAGKFFFFSGLEEDQAPLPVIEGPSRVPQGGKPAQAEEGVVDKQKDAPLPDDTSSVASSPVVVSSVPSNSEERRTQLTTLDVLAVPYDSKSASNPSAPQEVTVVVPQPSPPPKPQSQSQPRPVPVVREQPKPQPVANPVAERRTPPVSEPPKEPEPAKPSWMVQVGAFSTRAAADAVSQQVTKAGYSATVVAGKSLHRVLIQAGPTREDALALATRMSQTGFQGAFIVPPR